MTIDVENPADPAVIAALEDYLRKFQQRFARAQAELNRALREVQGMVYEKYGVEVALATFKGVPPPPVPSPTPMPVMFPLNPQQGSFPGAPTQLMIQLPFPPRGDGPTMTAPAATRATTGRSKSRADQVVEILATADHPLTRGEIRDELARRGTAVNVNSVSATLSYLLSNETAERLPDGGWVSPQRWREVQKQMAAASPTDNEVSSGHEEVTPND
jgi:hypothetical protein